MLMNVNSKMDYQEDKKILEQKLEWEEIHEKIRNKYQQDVFYYLPSQQKFKQGLYESQLRNWLLGWNLF
jgi:hypothetical protein